jgi:translation elongation factor P/translation initiation factor 5A
MWRNILAGTLFVTTGWTQQMQPAPKQQQPGSQQQQAGSQQGQAMPAVGTAEIVSQTNTVVKVDKGNHKLTLKDPEGKQFTVDVGTGVPNFDQIKEGDKVNVKYYQAVAIALHKPGESAPAMEVQAGAARVQSGRPAGMVGETVTATMSIVSVDAAKNKLTLKAQDGTTQTLDVKDPTLQKQLPTLKAGDQVSVSYTEAVAISLATPKM